MERAGEILLLSDPEQARQLIGQIEGIDVRHVADPYDALVEAVAQRWPVVLLWAPRADLGALARALRKLLPDARLLGLTPPTAEPELKPLAEQGLIDDYLILPLSRQDRAELARLARPAATVEEPPPAAGADHPAPSAADLPLESLAGLIEAAGRMDDLDAALGQLVGEWLGTQVRWVSRSQAPQARPLLKYDNGEPRGLVAPDAQPSISPDVTSRLEALQRLVPSLVANARRTEHLHRLAISDHLTGAYNRRYFYEVTDRILSGRHEQLRAAVLLFDIDNFKSYNADFGYAVGDQILQDVTRLIRQSVRAHDIVARIGGDEFAVLFWETAPPRVADSTMPRSPEVLAERFRQAVHSHRFAHLGPNASGVLTISGGLAGFPRDGRTCRELLRSADNALRQAKRSGKDTIRLIGQ